MHISLCVEQRLRASSAAVFALSLDAARFPATFAGCGPIPAIRRITLHAPPAVGSTRELENSDGSRLSERITALEPSRRHAYTLSGIRPPLAWLARCGHADWSFADDGAQACFVVWRYRFELSHALAWPLAFPLLRIFMRGAMRRCLVAMDALLAAEQETAR